ncbi:MAG: hypothetical protein HC797_03085 [Anaerolineales bacterium]|nr:hypothetical protein [Anaerolineales bacterium]
MKKTEYCLLQMLLHNPSCPHRRKQIKDIVFGILIIAGLMIANLLFFSNYGLPIQNLWTSSFASGQGGNYSEYLVTPELNYYIQIINLLFLLAPFCILLIPLLIYKRIQWTTNNLFLIISIAGMLCLMFGWKAQLGVYNDWNLFAIIALPISLLVWGNFKNIPNPILQANIPLIAGFVFYFHSLVWIWSNYLLR